MTDPFRLLHVVGARPQFIKLLALQTALADLPDGTVVDRVLHTGQHYDERLSGVFFEELGLRSPDHHLDVGSGTHGRQTARILEGVERVLLSERPDAVVVYGDTNSTLGAALAAVKLHVPVAHVEAGLRSRNRRMPEEINRILVDHCSTWCFAPSAQALANLQAEGLEGTVTGDVMRDVVRLVSGRVSGPDVCARLGLTPHGYHLLTIHRAENTDDPGGLCRLLDLVATITAGRPVLFPVHPRTRGVLDAAGVALPPNVRAIEPLGYPDQLALVQHAASVLTDSGGLQKEAYWLRVPCITLRAETEWTETIASGWNTLVSDHPSDRPRSADADAYGDGRAAVRMVDLLLHALAERRAHPDD